MQTTARNATLMDLSDLLKAQEVRKVDYVVPASKIVAHNGNILVLEEEPVITEDGVTIPENREFVPTRVADEGIADKLDIPVGYLRRLREQNLPLWTRNINGWLAHERYYEKKYLLRTFRPDADEPGILRAFLSDRFAIMDHLDILMASLEGVRQAGVPVDIVGADLSERRMTVRVKCEAVKALAPTLLQGYRSPYSGLSGSDNPTVFAGFEFSNSETGGGAWSIVPRLIVQVCDNGMKITRDAVRNVHLGGQMDEGVIDWSAETRAQAVALVRSKTVDAVKTFLDVDYMTKVIEQVEEKADERVKVDDVKVIAKAAKFTEAQVEGILGFFVEGGQMTVGGVFNAATAFAQTVEDPDAAYDAEVNAARIMALA